MLCNGVISYIAWVLLLGHLLIPVSVPVSHTIHILYGYVYLSLKFQNLIVFYPCTRISTRCRICLCATLVIRTQGDHGILDCRSTTFGNPRKSWLSLKIIHKGRSSNGVVDALAKLWLRREDEFSELLIIKHD